jgi:hypothetical protein
MKDKPLETPDGLARPVCGKAQDAGKLGMLFTGQCSNCVRLLSAEPKRGTGLSERQTEVVATGSTHGDPEDAERRRAGEIAAISGDAITRNAQAVEALRAGDKDLARAIARDVDTAAAHMPHGRRKGQQGTREIVPSAPSAVRPVKADTGRVSAGQRGEASIDGPALVSGGNMAPVQPKSGWAAKAGTLSQPVGRERVDAGALGKLGKHDRDLPECGAMRCQHIYGGLPEGLRESITWAEYAKLSRSQQRTHQRAVKRAREEAERAETRERARNRRLPTSPGAECAMGDLDDEGRESAVVALMAAPGRGSGRGLRLDWSERQATVLR